MRWQMQYTDSRQADVGLAFSSQLSQLATYSRCVSIGTACSRITERNLLSSTPQTSDV